MWPHHNVWESVVHDVSAVIALVGPTPRRVARRVDTMLGGVCTDTMIYAVYEAVGSRFGRGEARRHEDASYCTRRPVAAEAAFQGKRLLSAAQDRMIRSNDAQHNAFYPAGAG
jgi:hypothetical protein